MTKKDVAKAASRRNAPKTGRPGRSRKIIHLLVLFLGALTLADGLVGDRGLLAMLRARHEYEELSASIARQRAENTRLRDLARRLSDDPATIEEIARRDLGLIRPGEKVFIIKDLPAPKPTQ